MKKETKGKLINAFDEVEFMKSDIGKNSLLLLIAGFIMLIGGLIGFFIVLDNEVSKESALNLLSILFIITVCGAFFGGIYLGQIRHYILTKKK